MVVFASLRVIFNIVQDGSVGLSASYLTSYIEGNACLSVSYHIKQADSVLTPERSVTLASRLYQFFSITLWFFTRSNNKNPTNCTGLKTWCLLFYWFVCVCVLRGGGEGAGWSLIWHPTILPWWLMIASLSKVRQHGWAFVFCPDINFPDGLMSAMDFC